MMTDEVEAGGHGCPNLIERIEAGLLTYGSDITRDDTALEAGLDRYCALDAPMEAIGLYALRRQRDDGVGRRNSRPHHRRAIGAAGTIAGAAGGGGGFRACQGREVPALLEGLARRGQPQAPAHLRALFGRFRHGRQSMGSLLHARPAQPFTRRSVRVTCAQVRG